jgi:hypothetical protein
MSGFGSAMSIERMRPMVISLLALLAVLVAREAQAGFIRPRATFPTPDVRAGLLWPAGTSEDAASLAGLGAFGSTRSSGPVGDEEINDRPAFHDQQGNLAGSEGACGAEPSSQSSSNGSNNLAVYGAALPVPRAGLLARLPSETDPHFSNPPPWAPSRPPCARSGTRLCL